MTVKMRVSVNMNTRVNMKVRVNMMKLICIVRYPNLIISIDAISVTQSRIYRTFD